MRKGFTLIELSIVLVIIGLLIGGILAAQSMISTSKITATISQIQQFDAGVMNFKTKYHYLPGDAPAFGGNGDLVIAMSQANYENRYFGCEMSDFWHDIMPDQYTITPSGLCELPGVPPAISGASKKYLCQKWVNPILFS